MGLTSFRADMVGLFQYREFGWVYDKEGIWVSHTLGRVMMGKWHQGFGWVDDKGGIRISERCCQKWWICNNRGSMLGI